MALTVDAGRITAIDVIRDPDKLAAAAGTLAADAGDWGDGRGRSG